MVITKKIKKAVLWLFETIPGLGIYLAIVSILVVASFAYGAFPYSLWVAGVGMVIYFSLRFLDGRFQQQGNLIDSFSLFIGQWLLVFSCGVFFGSLAIGYFQFLNSEIDFWFKFDWDELEQLLALRHITSKFVSVFMVIVLVVFSIIALLTFIYQRRVAKHVAEKVRFLSSIVVAVVIIAMTFNLGSKTMMKEWVDIWVKDMKEGDTWSARHFHSELFAEGLSNNKQLRQQVLELVPYLFYFEFNEQGLQKRWIDSYWYKDIESCITEKEVVDMQFEQVKLWHELEYIGNFTEFQQYEILLYYLELEREHMDALDSQYISLWLEQSPLHNQFDKKQLSGAIYAIDSFVVQRLLLRNALTHQPINRLGVYHFNKNELDSVYKKLTKEFITKTISLLKRAVSCKQLQNSKDIS